MTDRRALLDHVLAPEPGRTALLVVDMQVGFVEPGEALEVPAAREIVPALTTLIAGCRQHGVPVVFTEFVYSPHLPLLVGQVHPEHRPAAPGAPTGFGLPSSSCLEGHPSADTIAALRPEPGDLVIRKHGYDAFAGTALDSALRARGVTSLILTGTMTDVCVLATAVGAFHREYRLTVVEDAVATLTPGIQAATLDIIGRAYARVVCSGEVLHQIAAWRGGPR